MSHRDMTETEIAAEKVARSISKERHGSESLWQLYLDAGYRAVTERVDAPTGEDVSRGPGRILRAGD